MNSMPAINYDHQINPKSDYHTQDTPPITKTKFDSVVNYENSGAVNNRSGKEDVHTASNMKQDNVLETDGSVCNHCSSDVDEPPKNILKDKDRKGTECVEIQTSDTERSGNESDSVKNVKVRDLLFELITKYMAGIENGSGANNNESDESGTELNSEIGLEISKLLNDLINSDTADKSGSGLNSGNGLEISKLLNDLINSDTTDESGSGLNSGNGLEISKLLNDLINGDTTDESGSELNSDNGFKVGNLINSLINNDSAETEGGFKYGSGNEEGSVLIETESADNGMKLNSANGLKTRDLLNSINDRSSMDINDSLMQEDVSIDEGIHAEETIDINAESIDPEADNLVFKKETPAQAELGDVLKNIKKVNSDEEAVDLDFPESHNGTEGLRNKLMSEFSDDFNNENMPRNDSFNFAKSPQNSGTDSANNNINLINSADVASEGTRSIENLYSGNSAKVPEFQKLMDNIVYVIKSHNKLGVSVEYENLGKLNISLSLDKGIVNIHINTSDKAVREFIENNVQHIIDSLDEDGVSVGEFSIALKDNKNRDDYKDHVIHVNDGQAKEYIDEVENERHNKGLVNIFA